jgi:hypothetical protein
MRKDVVFRGKILKYPLRTFWVENPPRPCEQTDFMHKPLLQRALRAGSPGTSVREAYVKLAAQDGFDACQQYTLVAAEHLCTYTGAQPGIAL